MVLQSRFEELVQRARQTLNGLRTELLNERVKEGYWEGKLSPSSLKHSDGRECHLRDTHSHVDRPIA